MELCPERVGERWSTQTWTTAPIGGISTICPVTACLPVAGCAPSIGRST